MGLRKKDFIFLIILTSMVSLFGILSNPNTKTSAQNPAPQTTIGVSEENPLVEGIKQAFGRVLRDSVPITDGDSVAENLPSGVKLKYGVSLSIPKLGFNKPVFEAEKIGDNYLVGDKEIFEEQRGSGLLIYGHNSKDVLGEINHLSYGDEIIRKSAQGVKIYQVKSIARLSENNPRAMDTAENELVLLTCDLWENGLRIIIKAELIQ